MLGQRGVPLPSLLEALGLPEDDTEEASTRRSDEETDDEEDTGLLIEDEDTPMIDAQSQEPDLEAVTANSALLVSVSLWRLQRSLDGHTIFASVLCLQIRHLSSPSITRSWTTYYRTWMLFTSVLSPKIYAMEVILTIRILLNGFRR